MIYVGRGAKGTVKDSHILQTMTVYVATDNKVMYVCVCVWFLFNFLGEYTSHGQVDGNCFETFCT
jgi:hypothetical protein